MPKEIADRVDLVDSQTQLTYPDELPALQAYPEGSRKTVVINAYERNARARQRCIDHYGSACSVCNISLASVYGDIGTGYIHVHHVTPLTDISDVYEVDPIKDLRPVCPNCHAMLHRRRPPFSVEELRNRLL